MPPSEPYLAIVLRAIRYGDADLIAHLFTSEGGRRNAIAKGARRQKTRLGTRLEPFTVIDTMLRRGRGDLAIVESIDVVAPHDRLRGRYAGQQLAAAAFDMLTRLSVEDAANDGAFHLTCRLLSLLDTPEELPRERLPLLLAAYQLKLLHLTGLAPHLQSCTRCGSTDDIDALSARDGGVVCATCREAGDAVLDAVVRGAAAWALQRSLPDIVAAPDAPSAADASDVMRRVIDPVCAEHAGFRPRAAALNVIRTQLGTVLVALAIATGGCSDSGNPRTTSATKTSGARSSTTVQWPISEDPPTEANIRIVAEDRAAWGLNADPEFVRDLLTTGSPDGFDLSYGIVMTKPEYERVRSTGRAGIVIEEKALQYGRQYPDAFAGSWTDWRNAVIRICFTNDVDGHARRFRTERIHDRRHREKIRFCKKRYSMVELCPGSAVVCGSGHAPDSKCLHFDGWTGCKTRIGLGTRLLV